MDTHDKAQAIIQAGKSQGKTGAEISNAVNTLYKYHDLGPQALQIHDYGKANGKSDAEIEKAVQKYQTEKNPPPQQGRNLLQKGAGFIADPIAKLGVETGNLIGKGIIKGVEQFQSPENKAKTEQGLQRALNTPSTVPGLGTPVKGLNQVTGKDVAGQALGGAGLLTGNPMIAGAFLGAGGALEDNQGVLGVALNTVGGALSGKILELGFKAVAPYVEKAIQKYGVPMFEKLASKIPEESFATFKAMAEKVTPQLKGKLSGGLSKVQDVASNIDKGISGKISGGLSKTGDALAGKEAVYTAGKISNVETQAFIPKEQGGQGKTFSNIVDTVEKGINTFKQKSMQALNDVKSKITGTNFKEPDIAQVVNDKLTSVLGDVADSKGIKGIDMTNASVDKLKSYGLINDQEEKLIKGMIKTITDNPNITDRGILNLKEDLYKKYYKIGNQDYTTSNKIVKSIYDGLNELVGSANKPLKPALDIASKNIADSESMVKQLLGNGAEREAKLKSIATNLKNGAVNADDIKLLQQLEQATGTKILPSLEGYGNYVEMLSEKNKTGKFPTAKGIKSNAIIKKLKFSGLSGLGVAGYEELKHLGIPLP